MPLFKKKEPEPSPTQTTPTDQVMQLRQQGLTDNQIIQALQKDGFASAQIFDAMSQADIKVGVETAPAPIAATPAAAPPGAPAVAPAGMPEMAPPQAEDYAGNPTERIEEIAEAIIDEKWEVLVKDIHKIVEWKDETDSKMSKIESEVSDLREDFDKLHKAIISKIDEYDKNLSDVGSEIKSMNQVFQKILPTFTENISTLSRITKKLSLEKSK
ncbi:hypothetical protein KY313_00095 [Candidatus Woesearchaeota archaeon]|jgi:hypothetical protein|nr:hypothetical protein [Candidatus Woesearchaeota archaeon]